MNGEAHGMLTIDVALQIGSTEPAEASRRCARMPAWLIPLTAAAVVHLCLLALMLAAPRWDRVGERLPEVLPVSLYTIEELPAVEPLAEPIAPRRVPAPSGSSARPKRSNAPARIAPRPSVAAPGSEVSDPRPSLPQEALRPEIAAPPVLPEGAVEPGGHSAGAPGAAPAGAEDTVVLARPRYRQNPSPSYPESARRRQLEGTVVLEVLVSMEGRVGELTVLHSSSHQLLDQAALEAVRLWLFEPGRRGGAPLAMKILVPVRFDLH